MDMDKFDFKWKVLSMQYKAMLGNGGRRHSANLKQATNWKFFFELQRRQLITRTACYILFISVICSRKLKCMTAAFVHGWGGVDEKET